ncbi:hypothetical protein Pint_22930 [Pistacia integerrima]|uniref:Uncharacterized protein n=1 Tax=Pistacia integerrima TaxID=434235 RepID=A0ACC0YK38_9ROSI|nr:hypothetical protein Pint_22930 [Pistacia integerrima]
MEFRRRGSFKEWRPKCVPCLKSFCVCLFCENYMARYGTGNWKVILKSDPDAFAERTEVDLKDKWRNMMR